MREGKNMGIMTTRKKPTLESEGEGEELIVVASPAHPHPNPPPERGEGEKGPFSQEPPLESCPLSLRERL